MTAPTVQVISMGVTSLNNPNKKFSVYFLARQDARKAQEAINKTLPLPRSIK